MKLRFSISWSHFITRLHLQDTVMQLVCAILLTIVSPPGGIQSMNVDQDLKLNFGNLGEGDSEVVREPPERFFGGALAGVVVSKSEGVRGQGHTSAGAQVPRLPGYNLGPALLGAHPGILSLVRQPRSSALEKKRGLRRKSFHDRAFWWPACMNCRLLKSSFS